MLGRILLPTQSQGVGGALPPLEGNALRRLGVDITTSVAQWVCDQDEVINAEEANADIRSITRTGYENHKSYVALQTLIDQMGAKKTIKLPANGIFDLDGNMLELKASRQRIVSDSRAEITNGGITMGDGTTNMVLQALRGLTITGATPIGIDLRSPWCNVSDVDIHSKTTAGVRNTNWNAFWCTLENMAITSCSGHGVYLHMNDGALGDDRGDIWMNTVKIMGCGVGMEVGRFGGVNMSCCKLQQNTQGGLLFRTQNGQVAQCWGHYIGNSSFEDNTGWDFKTDMEGAAPYFPDRIQVVGGTIHKTVIQNGKDIVFGKVLLPVSVAVNATQGTAIFDHCPPSPKVISGTGKWVAYDLDTATGNLWIRTSTRLKVTSQDGTTFVGAPLSSIAATPPGIGMFAVVNGVGYISTGVSSPADWKQITN